MTPKVTAFFDEATFTITYVVQEPEGRACAIVDSVLDFDYASGRTDTRSADAVINYVQTNGLEVQWILESHVHADHLSAAPYIQQKTGGKIGIGDRISVVQDTFGKSFNEGTEFQRDGSQFEQLFKEGDSFMIGQMRGDVLHTPGHTPACMTHVIGDALFVGDTIFMPDFGTARCDFPGGDAGTLFDSVQTLFAFPDDTRVFLCHDYKAPGRDHFQWQTTIGDEKRSNIHVKTGTSRDAFIEMRTKRDATLAMPKLILPSVQINMRAGDLPPPESNGMRYMKLPINAL